MPPIVLSDGDHTSTSWSTNPLPVRNLGRAGLIPVAPQSKSLCLVRASAGLIFDGARALVSPASCHDYVGSPFAIIRPFARIGHAGVQPLMMDGIAET